MASLYTPNFTEVPVVNQMVSGDISLPTAIAYLAALDIDCLLVIEAGRLRGWLTTQDVVKLAAQGRVGDNCTLKMVMTQPPYILNAEEAGDLSLVLQYLQKYRVDQLPVVADNGEVLGLVIAQGIMPLCNQQLDSLEQLEIQIDQILDIQTEQNYLLQEVTDSISGLIYIYDLEEQRNIYTNKSVVEFLGYSSLEIENMGEYIFSKLIHPEDLPKILALAELQKNTISGENTLWGMEYRMRHADGSWRWLSSRDRPFRRHPDGRTKQTIGVAQDITDRKHIELELQSSQHFLQTITETIPGLVYIYDLQAEQNIYINTSGLKVLGYNRAQIDELGSSFLGQIINPEDLAIVTPLIMEQLAAGTIAQSEYRLKNAQGEWRWFLEQTTIFQASATGVPQQILGVSIDIHDRKLAEAALQNANIELDKKVAERTQELWQMNIILASEINEKARIAEALQQQEEFFRAVFEQAAVGINIATVDGKLLKVNQKMCQMVGYTEAELLTMTWMDLTSPEFITRGLEFTVKRHRGEIGEQQFEKQQIRKDGSRMWASISISLWKDPTTGITYDLAVTQDISDRKVVELALRKSEERFQRMVANIPGMVYQFRCDTEGNYQCTYANHYAEELYEISPLELMRDINKFMHLTHPEDLESLHNSILISFNTLQPWHWLGRTITPSGKLKWIEGNARPEKQANGDVIWDGILMDVTDRKAAEDQIQANLQEKELLLKEIHHRVKNNLQVVSSLLKLQSDNVTDENILALFQDSQTRIFAIALIHEQLYKTTHFERVNFAEYVDNLVSYLSQLYSSS